MTAHNFSQLSQSKNIMKPLFIPSLAHFRTHFILKSFPKAEQLKKLFLLHIKPAYILPDMFLNVEIFSYKTSGSMITNSHRLLRLIHYQQKSVELRGTGLLL